MVCGIDHQVVRWKKDRCARVHRKIAAKDLSVVHGAKDVDRIANVADVQPGSDTDRDEISRWCHCGGVNEASFENVVRVGSSVRIPGNSQRTFVAIDLPGQLRWTRAFDV